MPSRNTGSTSSRYIFRSDARYRPSPGLIGSGKDCRSPSPASARRREWEGAPEGAISGLGQRDAVAHAAPISVFLNFAAHAAGDDRDALGPSNEENRVS